MRRRWRIAGRRWRIAERRWQIAGGAVLLLLGLLILWNIPVCAKSAVENLTAEEQTEENQAEENQTEENQLEESTGVLEEKLEESLTDEMNLSEVQQLVDSLLGKDTFSLREALLGLIKGDEAYSKEAVQNILCGLFFSRIKEEKSLFSRLLFLILLSAVFSGIASVFDQGQVGELSFYVVYLLVFMLLMDTFSAMSSSLGESLSWMTEFMKGLAPAYLLAVTAAAGTTTAAVFYEGVLLLVYLIQNILLGVILPCINLYVFLKLVNHLSRESMLGKMAELLNMLINWGLKTLLGLVAGLQIVRALVAPVMDSLKRSAIGKTAGALPGVGNAVNAVTELVVTGAVLVRNSLGVVVLLVFLLAGAGPLIHYGIMSLACRFLAAAAQPVSDRRMVECLSTVGEGSALLLKVLLHSEVLCILTVIILAVSFGGNT